jgi:hypothetical protein
MNRHHLFLIRINVGNRPQRISLRLPRRSFTQITISWNYVNCTISFNLQVNCISTYILYS